MTRPINALSAEGAEVPSEPSKQRLALVRMLIWAEQEARSLGHEGVSDRLNDAISAIYGDMAEAT